jgi:hypothetical protein
MTYLALRLQGHKHAKTGVLLVVPSFFDSWGGYIINGGPTNGGSLDDHPGFDPFTGVKRILISREIFQVTLNSLLLGARLFVILSARYGPKDKNWVYGTIGPLVGYWLHL